MMMVLREQRGAFKAILEILFPKMFTLKVTSENAFVVWSGHATSAEDALVAWKGSKLGKVA